MVCCFDGDKAGRSAAWRALESALPVLNEHRQLKFAFLPDGKDPDSLSAPRVSRRFKASLITLCLLWSLLSRLADGLDLATLDAGPNLWPRQPVCGKNHQVLRDLVQARVRDLGGMARPLPRPTPHSDAESSTSATNTGIVATDG